MAAERLRVLILEDVPMDAELVEYELGRARIPFDARLRRYPGRIPPPSSTISSPT